MPQTINNMITQWNDAAQTFTAIKMAVTDTASNAASLLMDLQVGGTSRFKVQKNGDVTFASTGGTISFSGSAGLDLGTFGLLRVAGVSFGGSNDLILGRRTSANLRLGAADASAPVAQTLSVQSVVAGTSNTAGANLTITGSQGTGTGAGGSIVFQVAPAGSSGTAQNSLATALTINSSMNAVFAGNVIGAGFISASGAVQAGTNIVQLSNAGGVYLGASSDVVIARDAANTLALRNGANAQTFRVYNTTDGTNSEFGKIAWSSNVLQIGTEKAGTGTARALEFQTDGTTRLTIAANGAVTFASGITTSGTVNAVGSNVNCGSSAAFVITSRGSLSSSSTGVFLLQNAAANDFDRLQFGGTTSSFPALKRNSTALETKLADDSAYAPHAMQYLDVTDGITAPASATGRARIYVDTADGDLKVIFADGTVKTIVTDT